MVVNPVPEVQMSSKKGFQLEIWLCVCGGLRDQPECCCSGVPNGCFHCTSSSNNLLDFEEVAAAGRLNIES